MSTNPIISVSALRLIALALVYVTSLNRISAQVEHKALFKPRKVIEQTASPAPDAAARREAFAQRHSPAHMAALANALFGMMRLEWEPSEEPARTHYRAAVEAYRQGRASDALEAYKQFFVHRLLASKERGRDPHAREFIEYFSEAEDLMRGRANVAAFTVDYPEDILAQGIDGMLSYYRAGLHDAYHVLIDLHIGEPGEVHWAHALRDHYGPTWHMPRDETFLASAYGTSPGFFTALLREYHTTGDARYLARWAAYVDDFHMHYWSSVLRAGWADRLNWTHVSGPGLDTLTFVMRARPEAVTELPAATLARLVLHVWTNRIPLQIQQSRTGGPNRRLTMYGRQLSAFYVGYPELAERAYLLRQRRRTIEDHSRVAIHPDGTDQALALPYFNHIYTTPRVDIEEWKDLPEVDWLTGQWQEELRRTQDLVGSYVLRSLDPGGRQPGHRDPFRSIFQAKGMTSGKDALTELLPEKAARPDNAAVLAWHGGARTDPPSQRSFGFPYGGFYYLWSDWSDTPEFIHLTSQRPGTHQRWRFNNNIWLVAHGQQMLFYGANDYVLEVDGQGGFAEGELRSMPERTPQPNRFLCSPRFDLLEGKTMDDTRVRRDQERGRDVSIGPVHHHRQLLVAREAGITIVTDRVRGPGTHDFRLLWPFRGDFGFAYGSPNTSNQERQPPPDSHLHGYRPARDFEFDSEKRRIRTINPHIPNLSIYHASDHPLTFPGADGFVQNNWRFANALCTGPTMQGASQAVLASILFPRKKMGDELHSFTPVEAKEMAGFDAVTMTNHRVHYRASFNAGELSVPDVDITAHGEALLVVRAPGSAELYGVALGVQAFSALGRERDVPHPDVVFTFAADGTYSVEPIHRPLEMVGIEPAADRFTDSMTVRITHPDPGVEIRYTLDGSQPSLLSPLYTAPFEITDSTWVTAIAVRKGTKVLPDTTDSIYASIPHWAVYEREKARAPSTVVRPANARPGLLTLYKEDEQPISTLNFAALPTERQGVSRELFDLTLRNGARPHTSFGFVYRGYFEAPESGVYEFYAPEAFVSSVIETWIDLRVFVGEEEWYPATRRQNYGVWSIPLAKGLHAFEVRWIDQRPSMGIAAENPRSAGFANWVDRAPVLDVAGPGLPRQPVPAHLLWHVSHEQEPRQ